MSAAVAVMKEPETQRGLTVSLRPRRLSEMIGMDAVVSQLRKQLASNRIPNFMFVGEPGSGKTTLCQILARALQCKHGEPGEPCDDCLEDNLFDILEQNCAAEGKTDDLRDLCNKLTTIPGHGRHRIVILNELQRSPDDAQQVLLVPTEEEDDTNVYMISTTDPEKINEALKTRFQTYTLPAMDKVATTQLVDMAVTEAGQAERLSDFVPLVELLVEYEVTSPRRIIKSVEKALTGARFEQCICGDEVGDINIEDLFNATVKGHWTGVAAIMRKAKPTDVPQLKLRLSAWYRNILLKSELNSTRGDLFSRFILRLAEKQSPEYGLMLSGFMAILYQICQETTKARKAA